MQHIKWHFGEFIFAPHLQLLLRKHANTEYRLRLSTAETAILEQLLAHCGNLCEKETLTAYAWQGRPVSAQSLPVAIAALRKNLESGENGLEIKNIPRQGYLIEIDGELREELIPEKQGLLSDITGESAAPKVETVSTVTNWVKYLAGNQFAGNFFVAGCALLLLFALCFFYSVWVPVTCEQAGDGHICYVNDKKTDANLAKLPSSNQVFFISGNSVVSSDIQGKEK